MGSVYHSFSKLATRQRTRLRQNLRHMTAEIEQLKKDTKEEATRMTSGPDRNHPMRKFAPWAKRHGQPLLPLLPIGVLSGRLRKSLRARRTGFGFSLYFLAPYSKYALSRGGTRKVFDRKLWEYLQKWTRKRAKTLFKDIIIKEQL